MSNDTTWVHPDWVVGPDNDLLVELFGDVDWYDQKAVARRVADLHALADRTETP